MDSDTASYQATASSSYGNRTRSPSRTCAGAEHSRRERLIEELRASADVEKAAVGEVYHAKVERIVARYEEMKARLIDAGRDRRATQRRAENSYRAYFITLLQLDATQDRLYTLQHGEAPGVRKSRLQATRGAEGMALPTREYGEDIDVEAEEAQIQRQIESSTDSASQTQRDAEVRRPAV